MKRAFFFVVAIVILCSFPSQLLALPDGAIARLGVGDVKEIVFSPDGKYLAVASSIGVFLLDPLNLTEIYFFKQRAPIGGENWIASIAFSPDSSVLAMGSDYNTIKLLDVKSRKEIGILGPWKNQCHWVISLAFSPDGSLLASGVKSLFGKDSTIKLWDVKGRTNIATLEGHTSSVNSVAFSPDGGVLASTYLKGISLWDVKSHEEIDRFGISSNSDFCSIAFSPDGSILASGCYGVSHGHPMSIIYLWDVKSHKEIATLEGHSDTVYSIAFSPDGDILASGSGDYTIKLWDVKSHKEIRTIKGKNWNVVTSVATR